MVNQLLKAYIRMNKRPPDENALNNMVIGALYGLQNLDSKNEAISELKEWLQKSGYHKQIIDSITKTLWCTGNQPNNMNTVRAKFVVGAKVGHEDGSVTVSAHPVASGSEENKQFNDYTPGGSLQLHIATGKEVHQFFETGKEYYLDFTKAEKVE